jgi:hypothetical protein
MEKVTENTFFILRWSELLLLLNEDNIFRVSIGILKGHAVAWLVEALCHKPEGRWIQSR